MTFKTHRQFAVFWAYAGTVLLYIRGMTEINYYLALIVIVPLAKLGAEFPDIDHNWANVKTKNAITWVVNKLIHMTGGIHRSWQTHSIDIALIATFLSYYLPRKLFELGKTSPVNREVLSIIMVGFALGWLSHLFSDMLTSGKVKLTCLLPLKVGLVPKKLFGLKFNTGNEWENFVYNVTGMINRLAGIAAILFPLFYSETGKKIIAKIIEGIGG